MPYSITKISSHIVEVRFDGVVTEAEMLDATFECVQLQRQLSILKFLAVIADDAEVRISPERTAMVAGQSYRTLELRRHTRIAVIRPKSETALRFSNAYEEACRQRGWNARVHPDRSAAIEWLNSSSDSPTSR